MDCLGRDEFRLVALMGCAQGGKSEIPLNWLLHTVIYDPADILWCQVDKDMMRDFSVSRVEKMIRHCPSLLDMQLSHQGADNIFSKLFSGMMVRFVWPVAGQFTARPVPRIVLDDYDNIPEDIEGQGDALTLAQGRQTTFEGREKGYVASTPALGPHRGIEALVKSGTDETFRVPCPHCNGRFALDFDKHLDFVRYGTPGEAEQSARIICPHCGAVIEQSAKYAMMVKGVWAGPQQDVTAKGKVTGPERDTDIASFNVDGLMGFSSWGRLARLYREAEIAFETTQNERPLRAFYNVRVGRNYVPQLAGDGPIEADDLAARCEEWELGTVPPEVGVLTAAVDVQGNRFEVLVTGWGESSESWLIDRFAILQLDNGRTRIDPSRQVEHWFPLIDKVMRRRYPLANAPDETLPIMTTAIDTGGEPGVSDNAVKFWAHARGEGIPNIAITLVKGGNNPRSVLLPAPTYLDRRSDGRPRKSGPKLWIPNVHELKNMLDARLRRELPGPGYIHFPADFEAEWFEELTAERLENGVWEKVRRRNETLDLYGYNETARRRLCGNRTDLRWVPNHARPSNAAPVETGKPTPPTRRAATPSPFTRRGL
jgi:phage terminase large subunit GpA-like protein